MGLRGWMAKPLQVCGHWLGGVQEQVRLFWAHNAGRIVIGLVGGTFVLLGIIFFIFPGLPATLTMTLGFTVLASEFLWARRFLRKSKAYLKEKLPDSQTPRINRIFTRVNVISEHISIRLHRHIIKPLTPKRKRS